MSGVKPWHEDDRFWKAVGPWYYGGEERWKAAVCEVNRLLELVGIEPVHRVLDVCCGPGRHSLELARRGYAVTGVDRTRAYLDEARARAEAAGLDVEWIQADAREFNRPGSFDLALNLFTSIGVYDEPADDRRLLENVLRSLRPGGALVIDLMGREIVHRYFAPHLIEKSQGIVLTREQELVADGSRVEARWEIENAGHSEVFQVSHRLFSGPELERLLTECGFRSVEICGSLGGRPYDEEANRLVALAYK